MQIILPRKWWCVGHNQTVVMCNRRLQEVLSDQQLRLHWFRWNIPREDRYVKDSDGAHRQISNYIKTDAAFYKSIDVFTNNYDAVYSIVKCSLSIHSSSCLKIEIRGFCVCSSVLTDWNQQLNAITLWFRMKRSSALRCNYRTLALCIVVYWSTLEVCVGRIFQARARMQSGPSWL